MTSESEPSVYDLFKEALPAELHPKLDMVFRVFIQAVQDRDIAQARVGMFELLIPQLRTAFELERRSRYSGVVHPGPKLVSCVEALERAMKD